MPKEEPNSNKVDKRPRVSRRTAIRLGVAGLTAGLLGRALWWEPHRPRLEKTSVPISGLGPGFVGYRVAVLSDFHIPFFIDAGYVQQCIELAVGQRPDVILCPGDFCNSKGAFGLRPKLEVPDLSPYFKNISAPEGVFGVLGNHDYWLNAEGVIESLAGTQIRLLHNDNVILRRGGSELAIVGTPDLWEADIDLAQALAGIHPDTPRILMQHNPDLAEQFPDGLRVDLQISGHTHGGQVRVPFGPALILPSRYGNKYREGLVQGPKHRVYVTRGVGMSSTLPVRFCCPPEVTILDLVAG